MVCSVVDLPAPFEPMRVTISPSSTVKLTPAGRGCRRSRCGRPRARAGPRAPPSRVAAPRPRYASMTRGLAGPRRACPRRALAVVEDGDPVADAHDDPHVVLDEQDGQAELGSQPADEVGQVARLLGVHAGGRLVEQQELRTRGQRSRDLQPALVAVGQVAASTAGARPSRPTNSSSSCRPRSRPLSSARCARRRRIASHQRLRRWTCMADEDVVEGRHRPEQADVLERPADAERRHLVRLTRADLAALRRHDVVAVERDLAARRHVGAGDHVEERRLAGAVRPDQRDDAATRDVEVDRVDRDQAAEPLRDLAGADEDLIVQDLTLRRRWPDA